MGTPSFQTGWYRSVATHTLPGSELTLFVDRICQFGQGIFMYCLVEASRSAAGLPVSGGMTTKTTTTR